MSFIGYFDEQLPAFDSPARTEGKKHRRLQFSANHDDDGIIQLYLDDYGVEIRGASAKEFAKAIVDALRRANLTD